MPDDFTLVSGRTDGKAWEPFDDCAVCQAMKVAEEKGQALTKEELLEAMKKAKEQGGLVGGPPFDTEPPDWLRAG